MIIVVGSGPSGVSCAKALLARGLTVCMMDGGVTLEADKQHVLDRLSAGHSSDRDYKTEFVRTFTATDTTHQKSAYGSNFMYRFERSSAVEFNNAWFASSLAVGGLSQVWGASVFPFEQGDITSWPITLTQLEPHYQAVAQFVPLATSDQVEARSQQAAHLLAAYERHQHTLNDIGIVMGGSRHAFSDCIYCGLCMYGCPSRYIYNAASTLQTLLNHPNFSYLPGHVVAHYSEQDDYVDVQMHRFGSDERIVKRAAMVFLAAGNLGTAKIVLASSGDADAKLTLKDSQHFICPAIMFKSIKGVRHEKVHSLSQLTLNINDKHCSKHTVRLQLYTYMEYYNTLLDKKLGRWGRWLKPLFSILLNRLIVLQGYFHSDESGTLELSLRDQEQVIVTGMAALDQKQKIKQVLRLLRKRSRYLRFIPLSFLSDVSPVGGGNHLGGGLAMTDNPKPFTTDQCGKLFGTQRIHVVDASVFPSIPAQSPTLTIMANAYRIATQCEIKTGALTDDAPLGDQYDTINV